MTWADEARARFAQHDAEIGRLLAEIDIQAFRLEVDLHDLERLIDDYERGL